MTLAIEKSEYFLPVEDLIASDATERKKRSKIDDRAKGEGAGVEKNLVRFLD